MTDAQRFLERYANTPVGSIDKKGAQANLRRIGILTANNRVTSKYAHVVVRTESKKTVTNKGNQGNR